MDASTATALAGAIGALYEAALDSSRLPQALRLVTATLRSDLAQLMVYDPAEELVLSSVASHDTASAENEAYLAHFAAVDPRRPLLSRMPSGSVIRCEDHFDERFADRSEFYQDFLFKYGVRWTVGARFNNRDRSSTCLAVLRSTERPSFDHEDLIVARLLLRHMQRAARVRERIMGISVQGLNVETLVEGLPIACALVDRHGALLLHNSSFERAILKRHARVIYGHLRFFEPSLHARWITLIQRVADTATPASFQPRRDHAAQVHLVPLRTLMPTAREESTNWIVMIFDPLGLGDALPVDLRELGQRHRLTVAEADVLRYMLSGFSAKQIAKQRGTSFTTARSQIAAVREKMMCRTQRELIAMVLGKVDASQLETTTSR